MRVDWLVVARYFFSFSFFRWSSWYIACETKLKAVCPSKSCPRLVWQ